MEFATRNHRIPQPAYAEFVINVANNKHPSARSPVDSNVTDVRLTVLPLGRVLGQVNNRSMCNVVFGFISPVGKSLVRGKNIPSMLAGRIIFRLGIVISAWK
jgi:hypothetical protein